MTLLGERVHDDGTGIVLFGQSQRPLEGFEVMPVHRADVLDPQFVEHASLR